MDDVEVRCGRCGARVEARKSAVAMVMDDHAYALPLCPTHAEEVRLLLEHYASHRISVLAGNRLCLALTDADSIRQQRGLRAADPAQSAQSAPSAQWEKRHTRTDTRTDTRTGRGASLLVAEPAWFAGLPPEQWAATTPLEMPWTCANADCRVEQARDAVRTYARVRGHNALFAIGAECAERLGRDPEIEIE